MIMLLATFDGRRPVAIYMKVRAATYTLAAITKSIFEEYADPNPPICKAITGGDRRGARSPIQARPRDRYHYCQIKQTTSAQATVNWSYSLYGNSLRGRHTTWARIPTGLTTNNACNSYPCYLIFAEVKYTFSPSFGYFVVGTLNFSDDLYATPRSRPAFPTFR